MFIFLLFAWFVVICLLLHSFYFPSDFFTSNYFTSPKCTHLHFPEKVLVWLLWQRVCVCSVFARVRIFLKCFFRLTCDGYSDIAKIAYHITGRQTFETCGKKTFVPFILEYKSLKKSALKQCEPAFNVKNAQNIAIYVTLQTIVG